jgi:hypothetical protein
MQVLMVQPLTPRPAHTLTLPRRRSVAVARGVRIRPSDLRRAQVPTTLRSQYIRYRAEAG